MPHAAWRVARLTVVMLFAGGLLAATGPTATAGPTAVDDGDLTPSSHLTFERLRPGETRWQTLDVTSTFATDGATTFLAVTGVGDLADSIATTVLGCADPWVGDTCAGSQVDLAVGWRFDSDGRVPALPVPAQGTTHLRVGLTVDDDVDPSEAAELAYRLTAQGDDVAPGTTAGGSPAVGAASWLPRTGTTPGLTLLAAAALTGAGVTLLGAASMRRRRLARCHASGAIR
ncbi:hypothetical protein [Xylanimonas ulmi]|uniref:LPXTG-motif cell wall-anchored protein n=1 Tax=Xylanimonas ulmi TaxID=228973 RepID=A0A4Q7M5Y0_9MICO|nr:hypothetical protein [Xylanibacterium ulmi]RZS61998.1 hypothetical protein EV386_2315 [Xylanibacterium ulmi]